MNQSPTDGADSVEVTIDAVDVENEATFWMEALDYQRLYERPPYVVLGPRSRTGPRVVIQQVRARSLSKSTVHLDLRVADPDRLVSRLSALGGHVNEVVEEEGRRWTVMTDPEGVVFCVCSARGPE